MRIISFVYWTVLRSIGLDGGSGNVCGALFFYYLSFIGFCEAESGLASIVGICILNALRRLEKN